MICKVCGHNIQETNKFCSYCGTPIEAETVPEEKFETIKVQSVEEQNRNESPAEENTVPLEESKAEQTGEWRGFGTRWRHRSRGSGPGFGGAAGRG